MINKLSQFQVSVTAADMDTTITAALELTGRYVEGAITVPAGENRRFLAQALDDTGRVIYEGSTTADIRPNTTTELTIILDPAVPLVKLSPRHAEVAPYSTFAIDVEAYNIDSLYNISFRVHWDNSLVYPDSASRGSGLAAGVQFVPFQIDNDSNYFPIAVTETDRQTPIVDQDGNVVLATVYFTASYPEAGPASTSLTVEVTDAYKPPPPTDEAERITDIETDGSVIDIASEL